jgi:hypothetical protein
MLVIAQGSAQKQLADIQAEQSCLKDLIARPSLSRVVWFGGLKLSYLLPRFRRQVLLAAKIASHYCC